MNNKSILFLTKDAFFRGYLPVYGNTMWKTPNIDELASKGTVFHNHHTGAPSTIMSNMCMFTGKNAYESDMRDYSFTMKRYTEHTLWDRSTEEGFENHIIWDESWESYFRATDRIYCYGETTKFHLLKELKQGVGSHFIHEGALKINEEKKQFAINLVKNELKSIFNDATKPVFLWIHLPHVLNGHTGYGSDIEAYDEIVGICRQYFDDDSIFISADHGNMNGVKGKVCYGFDVYEPTACIPLITPRIQKKDIVDTLTSNVDIEKVIFDRIVPERPYILCDSAFYAQPNRKLAIMRGDFKYIYNKSTQTEELYDLAFDPNENCNIIKDTIYDVDRKVEVPLNELYYYNRWEALPTVRDSMRQVKDSLWREDSKYNMIKANFRKAVRNIDFIRYMYRLINRR